MEFEWGGEVQSRTSASEAFYEEKGKILFSCIKWDHYVEYPEWEIETTEQKVAPNFSVINIFQRFKNIIFDNLET